MKFFTYLIFAFILILQAACGQPKSTRPAEIQIRPADFLLNGKPYATGAELTAAIKKLPPPDSFYIIQEQGVSIEHRAVALDAIKNSGTTAPIVTVGNEQFQ